MSYVRAGVGVLVLNNGKALLGRRHGDPEKADSLLEGEGTWTLPGGKIDFHEEIKDSAKRELKEETGLEAGDLELVSVTNDKVPESHFVTIGFLCKDFEGEPEVREPEQIVEWDWFPLDDLPEPVFPPSLKLIKNYKDGEIHKH